MKFTIKLFIVKEGDTVIQCDGIIDGYTEVQLYSIHNDIIEKYSKESNNNYISSMGEAKDVCGSFGPYTISIIDKEIDV